MFTYPKINPVALDLGFIQIHWYGLMYLTAFALAWWLGRVRAAKPNSGWNDEQVSDVIFYGALGVVLGGRIGYILFYNFSKFIDDPIVLFRVWEGGMSYHGGLIGVLIAMFLFGRRYNKTFFQTIDFIAPLVPLGYFAGRVGNFINGELWGRPTDVPWGMVFPHVDMQVRHPSMIYQGLLGGVVLFIIIWIYSSKPRPVMAVSGLYLVGAGTFRIINEFFRQPDAHLGFIAFDWLTMGQLLSVPLVLAGAGLLVYAYRAKPATEQIIQTEQQAKKTKTQKTKKQKT
jgi:phosphatidylglycerol:prolipoprotein diacylglycerol transferase